MSGTQNDEQRSAPNWQHFLTEFLFSNVYVGQVIVISLETNPFKRINLIRGAVVFSKEAISASMNGRFGPVETVIVF